MVVVTGREPDSRRPDGAMSSSDAEDDFLEPATPTATQAGHALPLLPQEFPEVVPLNIGGAHFTTRLSTLRRYEDTMLAAMFSGRHYIPTDAEGRYFIDRDGTHFGDVLNFLRSGDLPPRERVRAVYKEAQYYAIGPLLEQLENMQPLKGEKVRQAFLGLMPYYKGEGSADQNSKGRGRRIARHLSVPSSPPEQVSPGFTCITQEGRKSHSLSVLPSWSHWEDTGSGGLALPAMVVKSHFKRTVPICPLGFLVRWRTMIPL
ncbi:hypothetical protein HJG60_009871 [Phyllostomus discolor]|uniref:BTB/POZ domain-containing protein KCTD7 n=1 Tax=Phyllostomus discolor TaxID=89673 RepID=A0A834B6Z6_9CHIR|nr:hypothetical protein HJG60_009871 [Phyllostomus discolor]